MASNVRHDDSGNDLRWMKLALREAQKAAHAGEVPVGAVIVRGEEIVARGYNQPIGKQDPTAHAEIVVLRKAARRLGNYRLEGCDLFVTLEPCPMCTGALVQARIRRLVFGAADPKGGAVHSNSRLLEARGVHHRVEVVGGLLENECGEILVGFFRSRRG